MYFSQQWFFLIIHKQVKSSKILFFSQVLTAELTMVDSKVNEYKCENQRLADELANTKKKYLSQKKLQR